MTNELVLPVGYCNDGGKTNEVRFVPALQPEGVRSPPMVLHHPAICRTITYVEWLPYQQHVGAINVSKHESRRIKKK